MNYLTAFNLLALRTFIAVAFVFGSVSLFAQQTVTTTVTWSTGWCNICPPPNNTGNYSCAQGSGSGQWNNGIRTFADPVPAGNIVTAVSVQVDKVDCGLSTMTVTLNGVTVQTLPVGVGTNCICGTCWPQTYSNSWACPAGLPSYVYGGTNSLQLLNTGNLCVKQAIITITYEVCCPPPAPPGPISGPTSVCQGDTVTYSIPSVPGALTYTWGTDSVDSLLSGQGTTSITLVIDSNGSDSVCVNLSDTCTNSTDTCIVYTLNTPSSPAQPSGDTVVCEGDTRTYTIPAVPGAINYTWSGPPGSTVINGQGTIAAQIQFGASSGDVCVSLTDACATSPPSCLHVTVNLAPTPANAGSDILLCSNLGATLNANVPVVGTGEWSIIAGGGTFSNINDPMATFSNAQVGINTLVWTITSTGCLPSHDTMNVTSTQAPTALFEASSVCHGDETQFTDNSQGNGFTLLSWGWDINGDNVTDYTSQNPSHTYPSPGTYSVRLIVNNLFGCADTITNQVTVNGYPNANFTVQDECHTSPSNFVDNSTIPNGSIGTWEWNFGDNTAPDPNPSPTHIYAVPGVYTTTLVVTSDSGCADTVSKVVEVFNNPVVNFSDNGNCSDKTANFTDNSQVPGGSIISWEWNFDDGSPLDQQQHPDHDFPIPGTYDVMLTVETDDGCTGSITRQVEINPVPVAEFVFTNLICLGDVAEFEDVSTIGNGATITAWDWQFGDAITASQQNPDHTYSEFGDYEVTFTVTSGDGCANTIKKTVPVYPIPVMDVNFDPVCEDDLFKIIDFTTIPVGDIVYWEWDFDDSKPKIQSPDSISYVIEDPGQYDVSLLVRSDKGCEATFQEVMEVYEKPVVDFSLDLDEGCSPLLVSFNDLTTISNSSINLAYNWKFGDGTTDDEQNTDHTYLNSGERERTYNIELVVTTDQGCVSKEVKEDTLLVFPQPIPRYDLSPERTDVLQPLVRFIDQSKGGNYWIWDFGDGNSQEGYQSTVDHAYENSGVFITSMVVRNFYMCESQASVELIVDPKTTLYIPTAFTPNGDGINDEFFAKGLDADRDYVLRVFDRWGNLLFRGVGIDAKWDGRDQRGKIAQQGTYTYKIDYKDAKGEKQEVIGNVSLIGGEDR